MSFNKKNLRITLTYFLFLLGLAAHAQPDILAYAGGIGKERFNAVLELSDGTIIIGGSAESLNWLPGSVPRITISPDSIQNNLSSQQRISFILHLSADMLTVLRVLHLPSGAADDIFHIKTNSIPGQATGDIFISGNINHTVGSGRSGGYFLAKLDNNFVNGIPSGFEWTRNVWATGLHKERQPWDVDGQGRIVYVLGESLGNDFCVIHRLRSDGTGNEVVNNWTTHSAQHLTNGTNIVGEWTPATSNPEYSPSESMVNLKAGRCSMRSWNIPDFTAVIQDENGTTKQGQWPLDFFYTDSCNVSFPGSTQGGPGYTGYRRANAATPYVGGIAVDKITNDIYIGACYQSQTSGGQPDFEPFVLAYDFNGNKKWWVRLYRETNQQSPPDQYVDGLAVDYASSATLRSLIVLGRQHGNAVNAFWPGDNIVNNPLHPPGTNTFNSRFTGTNGNMHLSWLAKYRLTDGRLMYSTYMAGFLGTASGLAGVGSISNAPNWPNHNSGNPDLSDTRGEINIKTDAIGNIYLTLRTRGFTTTRNGYQQQEPPVVPAGNRDSWGDYVVVYSSDLRNLNYSSMLTGEWNRTEPSASTPSQGGDNIDIKDIFPTNGGVLVVGFHRDQNNDGIPDGSSMPFTYQLNKQIAPATPVPASIPAWGKSTLQGNDSETAVFGKLTFVKSATAEFTANPLGGNCINTNTTFSDLSFSPAGIQSWSWNFGAGAIPATSTVQNPTVQWSTAGVKTIILTVTDSASITSSDTLFYTISTQPNATFTFAGPLSPAPTTLNFSGPAGTGVSYLWTITDPVTGQVSNYTVQNPSHTFNTGGAGTTYPVTLTVSNGFCLNSTTQNITISGGPGGIDPNFTINGSSSSIVVCVGQPVTFQIGNPANITNYRWFFGSDATPSVENTQGPHIITYSQPGLQTATLTVSNGVTTRIAFIDVLVTGGLDASFTVAGNLTTTPTTLDFEANSLLGTNYSWTFGNPFDTVNNTGSGITTSKLYTIPGEYIVRLSVTSPEGCVTTSTQLLNIGNITQNPLANFYFAPAGGACVNNNVTITEVATGGFSAGTPTFEWNFGADATPQSHLGYTPPPVRWSTPGDKIVTLRIGTFKVKSQVYKVFPYPGADFVIDTSNSTCDGTLPRLLSFRPSSGSGKLYSWDFDSQTAPGTLVSNSSSPTNIAFQAFRNYAVKLSVTANGCTSVSVRNINLNASNCNQPTVSAGILVEPSREGCNTNSYIITSVSSGNINTYAWSGIAVPNSPGPHIVTGLASGTVITLIVTDNFLVSDTVSVTIP